MSSIKPRATWRVAPGEPESLAKVPGHIAVEGIARFRLLDGSSPSGAISHCAAHIVSERFAPSAEWQYTQPHAHDCDEVNILLSGSGPLRFRYEVDGLVEVVESPCTVFLPAGTTHRMEAIGGTGVFICMHLRKGKAQ